MEYQSSSFEDDKLPWNDVELVVLEVLFERVRGSAFDIAPPASCPLPASSPTPPEPLPAEKICTCIVYCPDPRYWSTQM